VRTNRLCRDLRHSFLPPSFLLCILVFALLLPSFTFLTLAFLAIAPFLLFAPLLSLGSSSRGSGALFLTELFLALASLSRLLFCPLSCSALLRLSFSGAVVLFLFSFNVLR